MRCERSIRAITAERPVSRHKQIVVVCNAPDDVFNGLGDAAVLRAETSDDSFRTGRKATAQCV